MKGDVMKRLILLTLLLAPLAIHGLRGGPRRHAHHRLGPRSHRVHGAPVPAVASNNDVRVIQGLPMATPQRARDDARRVLSTSVSRWLETEGVPHHWNVPRRILDPTVQESTPEPSERDYGTVYIQTLRWDASPQLRERLVDAYERELAGKRLLTLGGVLGFVLVCLGAMAGYIRADEATKGYYTNRLRLVAAAGVGAAGVGLYRFLA